jgi:hypothetical protein
MQLLPDEQLLVASNQDRIILTSQRIHLTDKEWGRSYKITFFLENISSIENVYKSNPGLLLIGALGLVVGIATINREYQSGLAFGGFTVAVVFLLVWLNSRRHVVTISSKGGGKLNFLVERMGEAEVQDFIDKVQAAKANRMKQFSVINI